MSLLPCETAPVFPVGTWSYYNPPQKKRPIVIYTFFKTESCKIVFTTISFTNPHIQKNELMRKLTEMSVMPVTLSFLKLNSVLKKPMDSIKPLYFRIITYIDSNQKPWLCRNFLSWKVQTKKFSNNFFPAHIMMVIMKLWWNIETVNLYSCMDFLNLLFSLEDNIS